MKTNAKMDCPACGGKMLVRPTVRQTTRVLRMYTCTKCTSRFVSEDVLYPIETEKGKALQLQLSQLRYEQRKMAALVPKPKKEPKPGKQKRKVAGPAKPVKEGEVYLTYGEIFKKFKKRSEVADQIVDYRPYPLLDHSIIICYQDGAELAMEYRPDIDCFFLIPNAMSYEDILAGKWRK